MNKLTAKIIKIARWVKSKLARLVVFYVKVTPLIISVAILLHLIGSQLDAPEWILQYLNLEYGTGRWHILGMFIFSYTYKFCTYHRVLIYYILINNLLLYYDTSYRIPLEDKALFMFYMAIAGIACILAVYLYLKQGVRHEHNSKHIKGCR